MWFSVIFPSLETAQAQFDSWTYLMGRDYAPLLQIMDIQIFSFSISEGLVVSSHVQT